MEKLKRYLSSEHGMQGVNVLFFLSVLFRNSGIIIIACVCWVVYLRWCGKHSESKGMNFVCGMLTCYAALLIIVNAIFLISTFMQH